MRTRHRLPVLLVAMVAAAVVASVATAMAVPRPIHAKPLVQAPRIHVVVKTVASLPGARYPWVYPLWVRKGDAVQPVLLRNAAGDPTVQPPMWITTR